MGYQKKEKHSYKPDSVFGSYSSKQLCYNSALAKSSLHGAFNLTLLATSWVYIAILIT